MAVPTPRTNEQLLTDMQKRIILLERRLAKVAAPDAISTEDAQAMADQAEADAIAAATAAANAAAIALVDALMPIGGMLLWGGSTPSRFIEATGQALSRTGYATLYARYGTTHGAGDGSTTFNVPDMRGRVPLGAGTGTAGDATAHALGQKDGNETHRHMTSVGYDGANLFAANSAGSVTIDGNAVTSGVYTVSRGSFASTASSAAARLAHTQPGNTMMPFTTMRFIIRAT